jgi:dolichyl-phosphate beta-glucosyltransferase
VTIPFLSIIIPARNEEVRLPQTLKNVAGFVNSQAYEVEVLLVVNGSTDRTLEIATSASSQMPFLKVIREEQGGKGRAVKRGMLTARGAYRFFCDADFSMPIEQINRFIPPQLPGGEVIIASREGPQAVRYAEPAYRHLTGRVYNSLVRWVALPGIQDSQCGFKCFSARATEAIFPFQTIMGWTFDVELLYIARKLGFSIIELGIPWYFNADGKIKVLRDSWRMFIDLLAIRRNDRQGRYGRRS